MTYIIGKVKARQFILAWFWCDHFLFYLGARLFSTQGPLYGAHFLQGLLCNHYIFLGQGAFLINVQHMAKIIDDLKIKSDRSNKNIAFFKRFSNVN